MDDTDDLKSYKKRNVRSLDNLFRENGWLQAGSAGSTKYDRGYIWNFIWCSEDEKKSQPLKVRAVQTLMAGGMSFEQAFDQVHDARAR